MANSRFEYVKQFELDDTILPHAWIVLRVDGKGFTKFSDAHNFQKPNDDRCLNLMNAAAQAVMAAFPDLVFAYGQSDEYSFVLHKTSNLYSRRSSKLVSVLVSTFTAAFVHGWGDHFHFAMEYLPAFDARAVVYPTDEILRDYLAWRQADCHINNQYNTCFWSLILSGLSKQESQATLKGTLTEHKNELLHSRFGINYSDLPPIYRKGTSLFRQTRKVQVKQTEEGEPVMRERTVIEVSHDDIIKDEFWIKNPHIMHK